MVLGDVGRFTRWFVLGIGDSLVRTLFQQETKAEPVLRPEVQTALVTGATSGVGEATALALARRGVQVYVGGRNVSKAEEVAAKIRKNGGTAMPAHVDLSSCSSAIRSGVNLRRKNFNDDETSSRGRLDLLVNNAGTLGESREKTMLVNLIATCAFTMAVLPAASKNFVMVNVGSSSHLRSPHIVKSTFLDDPRPDRNFEAYGQSKCGLMHVSRIFSAAGINCVDVHPGLVWTKMLKNQIPFVKFIDNHPTWRRRFFSDPDQAARTLLKAAELGFDDSKDQRYVVDGHLAPFRASPESRNPAGIRHSWRTILGPRLDAAIAETALDPVDVDLFKQTKANLDQACAVAYPPPSSSSSSSSSKSK